MMYVQCPKCFEQKPLGASHCPKCTQKVTDRDVASNEFWSFFWVCVILFVIWKLIT